MHGAAQQLVYFLLAAVVLFPAFSAASLTPPPPLDLQELADQYSASSAGTAQQLTWEELESQHAVLTVVLLPADPFYDDAPGVIVLIPCGAKKCLYPVFWDGQLPLGLEDRDGNGRNDDYEVPLLEALLKTGMTENEAEEYIAKMSEGERARTLSTLSSGCTNSGKTPVGGWTKAFGGGGSGGGASSLGGGKQGAGTLTSGGGMSLRTGKGTGPSNCGRGTNSCRPTTPISETRDLQWVATTPKGSRPHPSTYMSVAERKSHSALFNEGASRFMTKANYEKYGIGQRDGTSFVMPKRQADRLLSSVGGDPQAMEDALGLPTGFLEDNELVRVDIHNPHEAGLCIPSGNEAGANAQWLPGGVLPNGQTEGVIDVRRLGIDSIEVFPLRF